MCLMLRVGGDVCLLLRVVMVVVRVYFKDGSHGEAEKGLGQQSACLAVRVNAS